MIKVAIKNENITSFGGIYYYTRARDKLSMQIVLTALIFRHKQGVFQVYYQKSNRLLGQNMGS